MCRRSFSKRIGMRPPQQGVQMPASAARQIKIALPSPGVIGEPYRGPIKIPLVQFFTLEGWKKLFRLKMLGTIKSIYTLAKCRSHFQWRMLAFKQDTLVLYEKICMALAKGDLRDLRQVRNNFHWLFSRPPAPQEDMAIIGHYLSQAGSSNVKSKCDSSS